MARHLKSRVIFRLASTCATFVQLPPGSTPHKRGVHYFRLCAGIDILCGAMDYDREGQKYKKRIVVRLSRFRPGLNELYTYHFPKTWSAACVANRELIKEAQRRAHALEHDHSIEALEWRLRFFTHYFRVFKGGAKPEPGLKPYSRFYQYTYVAIYRELQAAQKAAQEPDINIADLSFEPIDVCSLKPNSIRRSYTAFHTSSLTRRAFTKAFPEQKNALLLQKSP